MSTIPGILFTAPDATAKEVRIDRLPPADDTLEIKGIDVVSLSVLWAIIERKPWDKSWARPFTEIYAHVDDWINLVPAALVGKIRVLHGDELRRVSAEWSGVRRIASTPAEAAQLIGRIAALATRAEQAGQQVYIFISL